MIRFDFASIEGKLLDLIQGIVDVGLSNVIRKQVAGMPESRIVIRSGTSLDSEAIKHVLLDANGHLENTLSRKQWENYKANIEAAASGKGNATKARLVAELDGEIVGTVFLFESSELAYGYAGIHTPIIRMLAVAKKARGLGVATELIRVVAALARESGAELVHLHTSDMMESAVRLYARLGFERAYDYDTLNGEVLAMCYRLPLNETELLKCINFK
ncbi:GNAT family N-acetyltransferase [Paenibacillus sp. GCM10012306]|uniref:GNAT family N-acetyltransferase n=1 Tax=Paenibacillus sp. GCM10012306 TaxID=3317342 RepID=UPI003618DCD0